MHGAGDVFRCSEGLHLGKIGIHLCRRFGVWCVLEDHLDPVDGHLLEISFDDYVWRDEPKVTGRGVLAEKDIFFYASRNFSTLKESRWQPTF